MFHSRRSRYLRVSLYLYGAVILALFVVVAEAPGHRHDMQSASTALTRIPPVGGAPYIVINVAAGRICLRTADSVYLEARCSAGSGGQLRDRATGRVWDFTTPAGVYTIAAKAESPLWLKPDWAYLEENLPIPADRAERITPGELGEYSLNLGDGLYIHGTLYTRLLGMNVTHGCIRVGDDALVDIYQHVEIGTPVFIF